MNILFVLLCLRVVHGNLLETDWSLEGFQPRVVILGEPMPGRFKLSSVLLGREHKIIKHDRCFSSMNGFESTSKQTCMDKGYWLGNENLKQRFTIIDTPSFGIQLREEHLITEDLIDVLTEEIRYAHVIVIALRQRRIEISYILRKMLYVLQRVFGKKIWDHVILVAPDWQYHTHAQMARFFLNLTEESWEADFNKELQNNFDFSTVLPSVFLDCTEGKKTQNENEIFQTHARELLDLINNKTDRFEFKDAEKALAEVDSMNNRINILINSNKERQDLIRNLTEQAEKQTQNFRITEFALILSGGSIILGIILALIMICIGMLKNKRSEEFESNSIHCTCDPEGAQDISCQVCSEVIEIKEETETLRECLALCGYSNEEIEMIQRIMTEN